MQHQKVSKFILENNIKDKDLRYFKYFCTVNCWIRNMLEKVKARVRENVSTNPKNDNENLGDLNQSHKRKKYF